MEITCYLSIGTNLGDKSANLSKAIALINDRCGRVKEESKIYRTEPKDFESRNEFLNCCVSVVTDKSPRELLAITQEIEVKLGRQFKSIESYTDRIIDIDILLYGDKIIEENELQIPHKRFRERRFVLQPLNDIANSFVDPVTNCTIQTLLDKCFDKSEISTYK
jgi:2-amino-4-hydroxy-6-hydroxymethyldihydropteridine diphosphokinase